MRAIVPDTLYGTATATQRGRSKTARDELFLNRLKINLLLIQISKNKMKKINAIIVSVTMLVAGLNFYFANCDAQSDFDLSMADVEQVAQGESGEGFGTIGRTRIGEESEMWYCSQCSWWWLKCKQGAGECTPISCAHAPGYVDYIRSIYGF